MYGELSHQQKGLQANFMLVLTEAGVQPHYFAAQTVMKHHVAVVVARPAILRVVVILEGVGPFSKGVHIIY